MQVLKGTETNKIQVTPLPLSKVMTDQNWNFCAKMNIAIVKIFVQQYFWGFKTIFFL